MRIIAAVDSSPMARPVIEAADALGRLLDARVDAVHVVEAAPESTDVSEPWSSARALHGDVVDALLDELRAPDVVAGVVGARRTEGGPRPAGHVAATLATRTTTPLLLVPPRWEARAFGRLVVPCEAGAPLARGVSALVDRVGGRADVVAVHVMDAATAPPFWEGPGHHAELWRREFLDRWSTGVNADLDLRVGAAAPQVLGVTGPGDLLVVTWGQDLGPGHAAVVREVLADSTEPVLLVATAPAAAASAC